MKAFILVVITLALIHLHFCNGYGDQNLQGNSFYGALSSSNSSSASTSSSSSSSAFSTTSLSSSSYSSPFLPPLTTGQQCCTLNSWAKSHMSVISKIANRVHSQYHKILSGKSFERSEAHAQPWQDDVIALTGKTSSELDEMCYSIIEKIIESIRKGLVSHSDVARENFFEWHAATSLEALLKNNNHLQTIGNIPNGNVGTEVKVKIYGPQKNENVDFPGIIVYGSAKTPMHYDPNSNSAVQSETVFSHINIPGVQRTAGWETEECQHFFWFLGNPQPTMTSLMAWEKQEEIRLKNLAQRYNVRLEELHDWHRRQLRAYHDLVSRPVDRNQPSWKQAESRRLKWFISQLDQKPELLRDWQLKNQLSLLQLARQYGISLEELTTWQQEELKLLRHNTSADTGISREMQTSLDILIKEHNTTISRLQSEILNDQLKLLNLSKVFEKNVRDIKDWLENETVLLHKALQTHTKTQDDHITNWQRLERGRLENMLQRYSGSPEQMREQIKDDRIVSLALKYGVTTDDLRRWQQSELTRLHDVVKKDFSHNIQEWQKLENERLHNIISSSNSSFDELQRIIMGDRQRLVHLANTYRKEIGELENWTRNHMREIALPRLKQSIEDEILHWRQEQRDRVLNLMESNKEFIERMKQKIREDQNALVSIMMKYPKEVAAVRQQINKELDTLKHKGLLAKEEMSQWEKKEHDIILKLVRDNEMVAEEFEGKLMSDRNLLKNLINVYSTKIDEVVRRIQNEKKQLWDHDAKNTTTTDWKVIERPYLLSLINKSDKRDIVEIENEVIANNNFLLYLRQTYGLSSHEIISWIKSEIKNNYQQTRDMKPWQMYWHNNATKMLREHSLTKEEFDQWLAPEYTLLLKSASNNNMGKDELDRWILDEKNKLISMGLIQSNQNLSSLQIEQHNYLSSLSNNEFDSFQQLMNRIREDRERLQQVANRHKMQMDVFEKTMKNELERYLSAGKIRIHNMQAWQVAVQQYLNQLMSSKHHWRLTDIQEKLQDVNYLNQIAFRYHISVEMIQKWLHDLLVSLSDKGIIVNDWQNSVRQRFLEYLQSYSNLPLELIEQKIKQDNVIIMFARQYNVSADEVERLVKSILVEFRNTSKGPSESLKPWQQMELDYIRKFIALHKDRLSLQQLQQMLLRDRARLEQISVRFGVRMEEIREWIDICLRRLLNDTSVVNVDTWKVVELEHIKEIIRQNQQLNYLQFEVMLLKDIDRLQNLASRVTMDMEELLQWFRKQFLDIKIYGQVQTTVLTSWQQKVQREIIETILKNPEAQINELRNRMNMRLNDLLKEIHSLENNSEKISMRDLEAWMTSELVSLAQSGLFKTQQLTDWQLMEVQRLQNWLIERRNSHINDVSRYFEMYRSHLEQIARTHSMTVQAMELLMLQEVVRMRLLNLIKVTENGDLSVGFISERDWKKQISDDLRETAIIKSFSWSDFEGYLLERRNHWELLAKLCNISVKEIEAWLIQVAKQLQQQNIIKEEQWKIHEKNYIGNLIKERQKIYKNWFIEELEIFLFNDLEHIQTLVREFNISKELIKEWYQEYLKNLLAQNLIFSEQLVDWQRREKERIYLTLQHYNDNKPSIHDLERALALEDRQYMIQLAAAYNTNVEQLDAFIRAQLNRLLELQLVSLGLKSNWQEIERNRLRNIVSEIDITQNELLYFISEDVLVQNYLIKKYGIRRDELEYFQRAEVRRMLQEGSLENIKIVEVQDWQRALRNNIFELIKTVDDNLLRADTLKVYQKDSFLLQMSHRFRISLQDLEKWQVNEYNRLFKVAQQYSVTLKELEKFHATEVNYIRYVMQKVLRTENQETLAFSYDMWTQHLQALERRVGLRQDDLRVWRRQLFLLCEGLITINSRQPAVGRGDQPPLPDVEIIDLNEPGLDDTFTYLSPVSSLPKKLTYVGETQVEHYHHHSRQHTIHVM